jgi:uncharacterized membrane protein
MTTTKLDTRYMPHPHRVEAGNGGTMNTTNVAYYERLASVVGGPLLALYGLSRGTPAGLALAAAGGALLYRGVSGHCHMYSALGVSTAAEGQSGPLHVEKSLTVNASPGELYAFWRDFANLPRFMKHLEEVRVEGEDCSHWVASGPAGTKVEWDAEITTDRPNEMIAWRSLPGAQVENEGYVSFEPAAGGRGTVVRVSFNYSPPAGKLGALVASLFAEEPNQQVAGDLRRFKNIVEAGEIPTTEGQPAGSRSVVGKLLKPEQKPDSAHQFEMERAAGERQADQPTKPFQPKKPPVTEASEESFPASDAPAWTGNAATGHEKEVGGKAD